MTTTRLVGGESLDTNGPAINGLKGLTNARDGLVHHKSEAEAEDKEGKSVRRMMKRWAGFEISAPNPFCPN